MNDIICFPGYTFDGKESVYRGEIVGEGGYVFAKPGIYQNVAVLDIASQHPTSIIQLNLFGDKYTPKFKDLLDARIAIKRKNYSEARKMLNGKLEPYLKDEKDAEALAYALKIVINIVYGLTSAKFPNAFKDPRNKDNIVAKRGALFMIDLKHEVQKRGFIVAHIKTDSIKIPNATPEIIEFVSEFGNNYGYHFEHETTYDVLCLVNDAVYIARKDDKWTAVGAQFQHPYVFKTLFTKEPVLFEDLCEMKNVMQGTMYLDFSGTGEVENMIHAGRTGSFVPVTDKGGALWRIKDGKKYAVTGTKDLMWVNRDVAAKRRDAGELHINMDYFEDLKQKAVQAITQFNGADDIIDFVY
jgi:hypothetical protein